MPSRRFVMTIAAVAAVAAVAALAACGTQSPSLAGTTTTTRTSPMAAHARARRPRHPLRLVHRPTDRRATLPVSHASSAVVQPQPDPGACHATGSGKLSQPDPSCTPGALNSAVTQATVDTTICVSGYTKTVRPPERITGAEKLASMAAYGDTGPASDFEYDHLVSLELGGASNDPRNLWPEPGASPNPKDTIENALHRMVCSSEMSLAQAQKIIATGWVAYFKTH